MTWLYEENIIILSVTIHVTDVHLSGKEGLFVFKILGKDFALASIPCVFLEYKACLPGHNGSQVKVLNFSI